MIDAIKLLLQLLVCLGVYAQSLFCMYLFPFIWLCILVETLVIKWCSFLKTSWFSYFPCIFIPKLCNPAIVPLDLDQTLQDRWPQTQTPDCPVSNWTPAVMKSNLTTWLGFCWHYVPVTSLVNLLSSGLQGQCDISA